jgi:PAS domain S-box-containing protein
MCIRDSYLFVQLAGITLIALRGLIPDFLSVIVANALVVGGAMLAFVGLEKFTGLRSSYIKHYLLLTVFLLLHIVFTYFLPSQELRNINVALAILIISFQNAHLLLSRVPESMRKMTAPMGYVFVFLIFIGILRLTKFFFVGFSGSDYFHSGQFEVYVALMFQIAYFLLIFFLVLMINRRLLDEIGAQEEKFSKAFKHSPYGIIISSLNEGRIIEINEGYELMTGYKGSEVVGSTTISTNFWMNEGDREAFVQALNKSGKVIDDVIQFRKANNELMTVELSSEIIYINNEKCVLSVLNDITEKKKAEYELQKSQQMLRRFASHLQTVGEEEKIMLATQIDNELNQTLVALKMDIGNLKQKLKNAEANSITEELLLKLDDVYKVVGNSLGFSLKLMSNLRNEVLYMMGFVDALKLYVSDFCKNYPPIKCHVKIGVLAAQPDQKQSTMLYRIFESAMSNVVMHSKATEVRISLRMISNELELEIADNGVGFLYNELMEHTSHGLMLMRERTSLLDGRMFITSEPGEGTIVRIVVALA